LQHTQTHSGSSWAGSPVILIKLDNPFHQQCSSSSRSQNREKHRTKEQRQRAVREKISWMAGGVSNTFYEI